MSYVPRGYAVTKMDENGVVTRMFVLPPRDGKEAEMVLDRKAWSTSNEENVDLAISISLEEDARRRRDEEFARGVEASITAAKFAAAQEAARKSASGVVEANDAAAAMQAVEANRTT
jgi:hypothetical protein